MIAIKQKIVSQKVVADTLSIKEEKMKRPYEVSGKTYKIKPPNGEHALYVTINNIEYEGKLRPFEMFINSKNMEAFSWIIALTRVISAIFRVEKNISFLAEELKNVFDPRGGFWDKQRYVPSVVAAIGIIIEKHLSELGYGVIDKKEEKCPKCGGKMVRSEGCSKCLLCDYSRCE